MACRTKRRWHGGQLWKLLRGLCRFEWHCKEQRVGIEQKRVTVSMCVTSITRAEKRVFVLSGSSGDVRSEDTHENTSDSLTSHFPTDVTNVD